ncbi:hypothetical protein DRO02_03745, partial [archaeon]
VYTMEKPGGRFLMTHDFGYQFHEKSKASQIRCCFNYNHPGLSPHLPERFFQKEISAQLIKKCSTFIKILKIREKHKAIKYGSISNVWESGDNTYAYLQEYEDKKVVIVINLLDREATSYPDLSFLPRGSVLYDELSGETFNVNEPSNFKISVPRYGSRILALK